MKLVGYKSDNGIELADGQHIRIYDKRDLEELVVDGHLEYLPGAFIINNHDGKKYLLWWYVREENFDEISNRDKYKIEAIL